MYYNQNGGEDDWVGADWSHKTPEQFRLEKEREEERARLRAEEYAREKEEERLEKARLAAEEEEAARQRALAREHEWQFRKLTRMLNNGYRHDKECLADWAHLSKENFQQLRLQVVNFDQDNKNDRRQWRGLYSHFCDTQKRARLGRIFWLVKDLTQEEFAWRTSWDRSQELNDIYYGLLEKPVLSVADKDFNNASNNPFAALAALKKG